MFAFGIIGPSLMMNSGYSSISDLLADTQTKASGTALHAAQGYSLQGMVLLPSPPVRDGPRAAWPGSAVRLCGEDKHRLVGYLHSPQKELPEASKHPEKQAP